MAGERRGPNLKERRNWLDLPEDIMTLVFLELSTTDILYSAQFVCSSWQKLAKQPTLFRCIVFSDNKDVWFNPKKVFNGMGKEAIERSCGEFTEVYIECYCTIKFIRYMIPRSKSLKSLRFVSCQNMDEYDYDDILIEVSKNCSTLKEIEFNQSPRSKVIIRNLGDHCKELKRLRFDYETNDGDEPKWDRSRLWVQVKQSEDDSDLAYDIAKNIPQLRGLSLSGSGLTNGGMEAILKQCTKIEYLDLRDCLSLEEVKSETLRKCIYHIGDVMT